MRVFKVTRPELGTGSWIAYTAADAVDAEFDGADVGDQIVLTLCEMTQDEIDALPEFAGW